MGLVFSILSYHVGPATGPSSTHMDQPLVRTLPSPAAQFKSFTHFRSIRLRSPFHGTTAAVVNVFPTVPALHTCAAAPSNAVALPSRCCGCSCCCPLRLPFARCHKRAQGKADGAAAEAAAAAGGRAAAAPKVITLFADAARAAAVLSLPPVPVPLPVLPRRCGCCPPSRCCGCSCCCSLRLPLARCQQGA